MFLGIHPVKSATIVRRLAIVPITAQVNPDRIYRLNQINLPRPLPAFQLLLPSDGLHDFLVPLEPHQAITIVAAGKASMFFPFVLKYPSLQIASNSDVKRM